MLLINSKIPIRIHPFFWVLAVVLGWLNSFSDMVTTQDKIVALAIWVMIILVSVLVHEFGHALSAIAFGQKASIDLVAMGGVTHRDGKKLNLWKEFIIVLNGPLFGFGLALLAYYIRLWLGNRPDKMLLYSLDVTFYVNVFWTIVNLLPIQPLDGGKLLSIVLESIFGVRGIKIALFISIILSVLVGIYFFSIQGMLAGSLFLIFAFESYRTWQGTLHLTETDQDEALQDMLIEAQKNIQSRNFDEANSILETIREKTKSGVLYQNATKNLANTLYIQGKNSEAYEILLPLRKKLEFDDLKLLHQLAFRNKNWAKAIEIGNQSYQELPSYNTALTNALSHAILGEAKPALGWLNRAVHDGMPNLNAILTKSEFDNIRFTPDFINFKTRLN